jgi:hypothetical protein
MLLAWLLPDSSSSLLRDGWSRPVYRPRHCKPPLVVRAWQAMGAMMTEVRVRYLDLGDEDAITTAPRPVS